MKKLGRYKIYLVLLCIVLFLSTRLYHLLAFPIFNDESFFVGYAQLIHADPVNNLYVSINRNEWKPPLSFWVLGLLMNGTQDPLWQARKTSVLVVLLGWTALAGIAYKLFGKQESLWIAILYIFSAYCWFYDRTFFTEPFVFTSGAFILLSGLYLVTEQKRAKKTVYLVLLTISGSIALLTKHTGQMYLYALPVFLLLTLSSRPNNKWWLMQNMLYLALAFAASQFVFWWTIPDQYFQIPDYLVEQLTIRFSDLFAWRATVWKGILSSMLQHMAFFQGRLFIALITMCLLVVLVHMAYGLLRKDSQAMSDVVLLVLVLVMNSILIFGLRNPEVSERHYYPIFSLNLLLLARAFSLVNKKIMLSFRGLRFGKEFAMTCLVLMVIAFYGVPSLAKIMLFLKTPEYSINKGDYGYFHYIAGWPSGFRIPEIVEQLKKSQPGILLVDPQLGNPGSALAVYQSSYPQLAVVEITSKSLRLLNDQQDLFSKGMRVVHLVFENGSTSLEKWRQDLEESPLCSNRQEFTRRDMLSHINLCTQSISIPSKDGGT